MQQQINLLSAGLIPPRASCTASQVLATCGVLAGLLLLLSAWDGYGLHVDRERLSAVAGEVQVMAAANDKLRELAQRQADPSLVQVVSVLRERKQDEQQLRQILVDLEDGEGFTRYFSELALVQVDGLWLDGLQFAHGGADVTLRGYAYNAAKVPEFLQRLAFGNGFQGHTFDQFELTETKHGNIRFEIIGPGSEQEQGG